MADGVVSTRVRSAAEELDVDLLLQCLGENESREVQADVAPRIHQVELPNWRHLPIGGHADDEPRADDVLVRCVELQRRVVVDFDNVLKIANCVKEGQHDRIRGRSNDALTRRRIRDSPVLAARDELVSKHHFDGVGVHEERLGGGGASASALAPHLPCSRHVGCEVASRVLVADGEGGRYPERVSNEDCAAVSGSSVQGDSPPATLKREQLVAVLDRVQEVLDDEGYLDTVTGVGLRAAAPAAAGDERKRAQEKQCEITHLG